MTPPMFHPIKRETDVIPAKAGIHASLVVPAAICVGARLRGHDGKKAMVRP